MSKSIWSRPPRLERKRILHRESEERKVYWDKLTVVQQLEALDKRLGTNLGAKRQRARLRSLLICSKF